MELEAEAVVNMDKVVVADQMKSIKLLMTKLADKQSDSKEFTIYADRLLTIFAEEALAHIPSVVPSEVPTPSGGIFNGLTDTRDKQLCVVSIIRSGDILLEAFRRLEPGIRVGKILIQRDEESEDKRPVFYYQKFPVDIADCFVLLVDPMLATAGSCLCAMDCLVGSGVDPKNVMFCNLWSCRSGLEKIQEKYPEMMTITLSLESYLNEDKYLVPGIGDFGDRYYGTNGH